MKIRSLMIVAGVIIIGIGAYDAWFSKYYLSDEKKRFDEKYHPFLSSWYLSKTLLWTTRLGSLLLLIVFVIMFFQLIQKGEF